MSKRIKWYFVDIDSPHIGSFDENYCYTEEYIREVMEEDEIDELTVLVAMPEKDAESFYCIEYDTVEIKEQTECGRHCKGYSPRNGKSGICRWNRRVWTYSEEKVVFRRQSINEKTESKSHE